MMKLRRERCAILPLVVKRKWFDMIAAGEKFEEYRLAKPYWEKRISNWLNHLAIPHIVELRCGYARNAPSLAFESIRTVRSDEWEILYEQPRILRKYLGEPDALHFIISLGRRVELTDKDMNL